MVGVPAGGNWIFLISLYVKLVFQQVTNSYAAFYTFHH